MYHFISKMIKTTNISRNNRWSHVLEETNAVAGASGDLVALLAPPVQRCFQRSGLIK